MERTKSPRRRVCVCKADGSKNRFKELDRAEAAPQRDAAAAAGVGLNEDWRRVGTERNSSESIAKLARKRQQIVKQSDVALR